VNSHVFEAAVTGRTQKNLGTILAHWWHT